MASQQDLDQGGTFRQWTKLWMGPSIGWVPAPDNSVLKVSAAGTATLNLSTTLVEVAVNADGVVIQLPSAKASAAGAGPNPGTFVSRPVIVIDSGGFAYTHNITIKPFGDETIDSLTQIAITTNFGAYVLNPNITDGGWTLIQQ